MRILMINSVCGIRSTGRICTDLAVEFEKAGHDVRIAYGRETVPDNQKKYAVRIGTEFDNKISAIHTRFTDKHGFSNIKSTRKFLKWAEDYNPDLLWLHNIHGYYINIELLFKWIKSRPNMQVKWTLHDCWTFTGHCSYFTMANCNKWRTHCGECPQKRKYPASFLMDSSSENYDRKKAAFTGVKNMQLITPSKWLADLVGQSFLSEYPVEVIYNTVDESVFKPTPSSFRKKYGLEDKKIILGVASVWDERKGLDDFLKLNEMLDSRYAIVLVGLSEKQIKKLPKDIIAISRTNSVHELAAIYTAADVFVNPTYEDNYPSTNLEAQACGTPVITYDTGGSPESATRFGVVVRKGNVRGIIDSIDDLSES